MPAGGFQVFGSGLQLQPTTPGTPDVGNVNLDGVLLASVIANGQYTEGTTLSLGRDIRLPASYTGYTGTPGAANNIFIGQTLNLMTFTANNVQGTIIIGNDNSYGNGGSNSGASVYIGNQQIITPTITVQNSVVIGDDAKMLGATGTGNVVIGVSANSSSGRETVVGYLAAGGTAGDTVVIGYGASATSTSPGNICIGYNTRDSASNNCVVIGYGVILAAGRNNCVVIGKSTQTDVVIGAYRIGQSTGGTRTVADASTVITATEGTILYSSITAARTATLPAANAVPAGYIIRILDMSGNASAVNTITAAPAGADTINGTGTPVIATAYGAMALMSDGVSKWNAQNQF